MDRWSAHAVQRMVGWCDLYVDLCFIMLIMFYAHVCRLTSHESLAIILVLVVYTLIKNLIL